MSSIAGKEGRFRAGPSLGLILRVNLLQAWRRVKAVRQQSGLLTAVIGLFVLSYLMLSFGLFYKGLQFVETFPGLGRLLTERLLFLLFAFLFVLLLFSNLVISYTNLFKNRETTFLLTLPFPRETVFAWKLIESTVLASWAFIFLIAPLLAAYGLTRAARWDFYAVTLALIGMFIVLPAVGGAWLAVNLARYLDRRSFQAALVLLGMAVMSAAVFWLRPEPVTDEMLETRVLAVLDKLLEKTRFAQFPFLPSYWLSSGVLSWSEKALAPAGFFALVLMSYALFFGCLALTKMGKVFYEASSIVQSRGSVFGGWFRGRTAGSGPGGRRFAYDHGVLERVMSKLGWIGADTRALVVKDIRLFWRDTTQWGQTLVLFGLLGVYIMNLRHFSHQLTNPFWVNLVSFLNLGACSLNLATLTTRFVYPQFSLEGKRLWIVGMAPLGMKRVIWAKFWLASMASLAVTAGLVYLSCYMLQLPWDRTAFFAFAVGIMSFTLNGLAVGLGVLYPNFKEDNPSKIVSGFGGTFCLVLSFLYILAAIVLLAFSAPWAKGGGQAPWVMAASWTAFGILSVGLGAGPMRFGLRKLAHFEV